MLQDNTTCRVLCTATVPPQDAKFYNDRIREDYAINWLIDGLPAAEMKEDKKTGELFFEQGFNLGYDEVEFSEQPAVHNHYDIVLRSVCVLYMLRAAVSRRVLGIYTGITPRLPECTASSAFSCGQLGMFGVTRQCIYLRKLTQHRYSRGGSQQVPSDGIMDCAPANPAPLLLSESQNTTITYTYRVMWNVRA